MTRKHIWIAGLAALLGAGIMLPILFTAPDDEMPPPPPPVAPPSMNVEDAASLKLDAEAFLSRPGTTRTAAVEMIRRDELIPAPDITNRVNATTATTSSPPTVALAPYVVSYIQPVSMLSAMPVPADTSAPGNARTETVADPSGTNALTASSYLQMESMLGQSPTQGIRDDWLLVISRQSVPFYQGDPKYLSATSALLALYNVTARDDAPAPVDYNVDDPEAMARGMYHIRDADEKMTQGQWDQAIEAYQEALKVFPAMNYANQQIGRLYLLRGEFERAIERLKTALSAAPDLGEALNDLGVAYLYANRASEALETFRAARDVDPAAADPVFNIGIALRRLGDDAEARLQFERCLRIIPEDPRAHRELAVLDIKSGSKQSALNHLHRAMDADQAWPQPVLDAATLYAEIGQGDRAIMLLTRALEIAPAQAVHQIYMQSVFAGIRLSPLGKPFEARLADKARGQM